MKKVFLFLIFAFITIGTVFAADKYKDLQNAPELGVDNAFIIDLKSMRKKIEDNIAFLNLTEIDKISFFIYFVDYNTGEWVKNVARGEVRGYNDRDIVELDKQLVIVQKKFGGSEKDVEVWRPINIKKIPFIAIVPKPAGDYEYKVYPKSHDVYIEIHQK